MTGSSSTCLDVPYLSDTDIEAAAFRLRADYTAKGGVLFPLRPDNLVWDFLDERDGLSLDVEACLGRDKNGDLIAGKLCLDERGGLIFIDESITGTPLFPFTLGHEVGHWVLHRHVLAAQHLQMGLFGDTQSEMISLHRNVNEAGKSKLPGVEWQANRFATHLLMPAEEIRAEFVKRVHRDRTNYTAECARSLSFSRTFLTLRDYTRYLSSADLNGHPSLIRLFGVSKQSMAIRLEELALVTASRQSQEMIF